MAINLQVGCVRKGAGSEPPGRILGIGGKYANGSSWYLSEAEAIERIQKDKWKFYVSTRVKRVKVKVAKRAGREYLRTDPDTTPANNLENLPPCPPLTEDVEPSHPVWDRRFP
jgi:hypothetical protein